MSYSDIRFSYRRYFILTALTTYEVAIFADLQQRIKVNRERTKVAHVNFVKYLGYSFYVYRGVGRLRIHPKSIVKLKDKIREVTGRSNGMGIEERKSRLNSIVRGRINYFKLAAAKNLLEGLDEWVRRRMNPHGHMEEIKKD